MLWIALLAAWLVGLVMGLSVQFRMRVKLPADEFDAHVSQPGTKFIGKKPWEGD